MENLKQIVESILFTAGAPVKAQALSETLSEHDEVTVDQITGVVEELKNEYLQSGRAFTIAEVAGGYVLNTLPENAAWINKFHNRNFVERLSSSTFETLSIIAYKQPLTRSEIESIRGVNCGGIIQGLLDRGLIKIAGRKEIPGRPFLYATTQKFLEYFRLKSIKDLPDLKSSGFLNR